MPDDLRAAEQVRHVLIRPLNVLQEAHDAVSAEPPVAGCGGGAARCANR